MIKILHLHTQLNLTCGITKTMYLLVKNLGDEFKQTVFTLGGDAIPKFRTISADVIISRQNHRGIFQTIIIFLHILAIVKKEKINIIHSHHRYFDLLAFVVSKINNVKTITSVQSKVHGKKNISYRAEILIACSYATQNHLMNYFGIEEQRIEVIHNFIDIDELKVISESRELKEKLGIDNHQFVIGYIGRINVNEKGIDILLNAFNNLIKHNFKIRLLMVGEGDGLDFVRNFTATHNLNLLHIPAQSEIYSYINIADVVVMPSRVEPFGIVAIEAGIMKKPIITSSVDGLIEIVDDEVNGLIINPIETKKLEEKLLLLIQNRKLCENLGSNLYRKVITNFTSIQSIPKYTSVYKKILKRDR